MNTNENFLLNYCNFHPEFLQELIGFPQKRAIQNRLEEAKNQTQFLSTISEFIFGKFFYELGFFLEYEKEYFKKTPDWTITRKTDSAIVEVYRLNRSDRAKEISAFQNKLFDEIQTLNFSLKIKVSFNENLFKRDQLSVSKIVQELKNWLSKIKPAIGNKIIIADFISIEILKSRTGFNYITCVGNISHLDYKLNKLIQFPNLDRSNVINEKISKYNDVITYNNLPYFIAVDIDSLSGFEFYEFSNYFRGEGVINADYAIEIEGVEDFEKKGETWSRLGQFYENENLSGVFLRYNNDIKLLVNPLNKQVLYQKKYLLECFKNIEKL